MPAIDTIKREPVLNTARETTFYDHLDNGLETKDQED